MGFNVLRWECRRKCVPLNNIYIIIYSIIILHNKFQWHGMAICSLLRVITGIYIRHSNCSGSQLIPVAVTSPLLKSLQEASIWFRLGWFLFCCGFCVCGFWFGFFFLWEYPHLTSAASSVYSWFLMVQPCIFLILVVLPLELLPQQLQLPFLCQEMIQLQVSWCLCSFTWTAAASQESTVPTPWLALLVFCLMRVSEFEGAFFF